MFEIKNKAEHQAACEELLSLRDSNQVSGTALLQLAQAINKYEGRQERQGRSVISWLVAAAITIGMIAAMVGCATLPAQTAQRFAFTQLKPRPQLPKPIAEGPKDKGAAVCFDAKNVNQMAEMMQYLRDDDLYVRALYKDQIGKYRECVKTGSGCDQSHK